MPHKYTGKMQEFVIPILVALIAAGGSILGTMIVASNNNKDLIRKMETAQAVTDTKIQNLTDEVHKHNSYAERLPILEEQMKVANHRIDDLEDIAKNKLV